MDRFGKALRIRISLLLLCCALMVAAGASAAEQMKLEGPGFDKPEQAVEAYLGALKDADTMEMLATFALETYMERFDFEKNLHHLGVFFLDMTPQFPSVNAFTTAMNLAKRQGTILSDISGQYLYLLYLENLDIVQTFESGPVSFSEDNREAEIEEFMQLLAGLELESLGTLRLIEFLPPAQLSDRYDVEANQNNMARRAAVQGLDEMTDMVARVDIGGHHYLFFFQVGRYADRWYNISLTTTIAQLMGVPAQSGGILPEWMG